MFELHNDQLALRFACQINGYQFPKLDCNNWCLLTVLVTQGEKTFSKTDPALEAQDLLTIRDWFQALADNTLPSSATLYFTEPCISFSFLGRSERNVRIAITLAHELRPDFRAPDFLYYDSGDNRDEEECKDWTMVFTLTKREFATVLAGINRTIERYPCRSRDDD